MSNQTKPSTEMLCSNKMHPLSHIFFCNNCASNNNQDINNTFFCQDCHPLLKNKHTAHLNKLAFDNKTFVKLYTQFKEIVFRETRTGYFDLYQKKTKSNDRNQMRESLRKDINSTQVIFKLCLVSTSNPSKEEFAQKSYRQWLVRHKFWTKNLSLDLKSEIQVYLKSIFEGTNGGVSNSPWDFPITLEASAHNSQKFERDIGDLQSSLEKIKKQQKLGNLFMQIASYFTNQEIQKGIAEINKIEKQPDAIPYPFLLYLAKLKILELHSKGSEKIKELLKEKSTPIDDARQKQLYSYYSAISEWKMVQDLDNQTKDSNLFYEPRNKKHYKLANPKNYIRNLEQAIKRSADNKTTALYYAAKAIGHMVLQEYKEAEESFQKAKGIRNDAVLCNKYFNNLQRKEVLNNTVLRESLSERSTQYVLNISKHLKKLKQYKQLKIYYEQLVNRQPHNLNFRMKRFENFFKLKDRESAMDQLAVIKRLQQSSEQEILECEKKIQFLRAQEIEDFNYSDAEGKYEQVASTGKASATNWYNYAAFLFKHRDEREKNEKALMAINKALEIKEKPHFYELKYLLLFLSGNMQEAKKLHPFIQRASEKFELMIEHVKDNV